MLKSANDINRVIVIGAGVMGEGIAQSFLEAGLEVCLIDTQQAALDRCQAQIRSNVSLSREYDVISESVDSVMKRLSSSLADNLESRLQNCDFAVETVPEIKDAKTNLFKVLDGAPHDVLLASNTSSFTVSQLTEGMTTAERVVGLHYFNPAHLIPAVEIHFGQKTSQAAIDIAEQLMLRAGKVPVIVRKEVPGFIINRLTGALSREIDYMLDEGIVAPEDLDAAIKASLGFRLAQIGPMEGKDFIGLDTDVRVSRNVFPGLSNRTQPSKFAVELVEQGHFGVKTGRGVYNYSGRSREDVLQERNIKLLEQRKLFLDAKERERS